MANFLEHGGNRFGRNAVPDTQAAGHKQILDALADAGQSEDPRRSGDVGLLRDRGAALPGGADLSQADRR